MKIAHSVPFAGKPSIHAPSVFGASTGKPVLYRIPVTGKRPLAVSVAGLADGLSLKDGVISGSVAEDAEFFAVVRAENAEGADERRIRFVVAPDTRLLTPLMGFTSWNAFGSKVTQERMEKTADALVASGLADYGYGYVNIDSGWQREYGGPFDAIQPNAKFPDMKGFCERTHAKGLKCGIYSTPMLKAWGCPEEFESIPGCSRGEPDPLYSCTAPIGSEKLERNNVRQWDEWGFDYLKYDWTPCDPTHAARMRRALLGATRDFALCVTVNAGECYWKFWRENCASWRCNSDSLDEWGRIKAFLDGIDRWKPAVCCGHYFDLDMMETGALAWNDGRTRITEDEAIFAYSMRAFFQSPLQLSCDLGRMTDFEFDLYTNDEVIAINQDALSEFPERVEGDKENLLTYRRRLEDGSTVFAVFNLSDAEEERELRFDGIAAWRDLWAKTDVARCARHVCKVPAHCAVLLKATAGDAKGAVPVAGGGGAG